MNDANHYRNRADIALRLADQISDARAAEGLRELAHEYLARAEAVDTASSDDGGTPSGQ